MKELFPVRADLADKISYYHLLLFAASLPFDRFFSHIILISFAIHTLIQFKKDRINPVPKWQVVLIQSVFLITVVSTIYSLNKPAAFNEWGRQITILLFPLVFYFSGFDLKKYRQPLLLGFALVCTLTVLYLYADAWRIMRFYKLPLSSLFTTAFVNHNFSQPIDMHATFLSMQLVIALVYLISVIIRGNKLGYQLFYAACVLVLFAGIVQLCSKSVFFGLFVIINVAVPLFLLTGKKRCNFMLITGTVSILMIAGLLNSATFKERYLSDLETDLSNATMSGGVESRLTRWAVAGGLVAKAPVIGDGAGSEIDLLNQSFFEKKYYGSFLHRLNAHSQYLSFLLKSGIIGLLVYLVTLFAGFKSAVNKNDLLFFTFMLLVAIVSFSENVMDVDKGIIFYAFFFSFFIFSGSKGSRYKKQPVIA
jgi:O-antigen ligase